MWHPSFLLSSFGKMETVLSYLYPKYGHEEIGSSDVYRLIFTKQNNVYKIIVDRGIRYDYFEVEDGKHKEHDPFNIVGQPKFGILIEHDKRCFDKQFEGAVVIDCEPFYESDKIAQLIMWE